MSTVLENIRIKGSGVVNSARFNFSEIVQSYMRDFGGEVVEDAFEAIDEASREAVKQLRKASRAQFGRGKYAAGWRRKLDSQRLKVGATIYGENPTYRLAHLLERSHTIRNAQGTFGQSKAQVHIAPIAEQAMDDAVDRLVQKLDARG